MVSPDEGWAAGQTQGDAVWHYSGGTWQRVQLNDPQVATLEYVSMLSADEGWGIGIQPLPTQKTDKTPRRGGAIWHYSGGQWQVVQRVLPDTAGQPLILSAIQAVAPGDVWVGQSQGGGKRFLHLVSGALQLVPAPIRDGIISIAMTSANEGWATGYAGQILHYLTLHGGSSPVGSQANRLIRCLFHPSSLAPEGGAPAYVDVTSITG